MNIFQHACSVTAGLSAADTSDLGREVLARRVAQLWQSRSWPTDPQDILAELGYVIEERSLSVGWARVLARIDMIQHKVYVDLEAIAAYAREQKRAPDAVRRWALAHEVGHIFFAAEKGATGELAANLFADNWL